MHGKLSSEIIKSKHQKTSIIDNRFIILDFKRKIGTIEVKVQYTSIIRSFKFKLGQEVSFSASDFI